MSTLKGAVRWRDWIAFADRGLGMIRQAISCDVCGTEKRQTNHWFVAFEQAGELRLGGWTSRNRARPNSKHLCGQTCLHKLVDEYLAQIVSSKPQRAVDDAVDDAIEYQDEAELVQPVTVAPQRVTRRDSNPAPRPIPRPVQQPAASDRDDESTGVLIARAESWRSQNRVNPDPDPRSTDRSSDHSLTADFDPDFECSARLIPTPEPDPVVVRHRPAVESQPVAHPIAASRPSLVAAPKSVDRNLIELPLADEAPSFSSRKWRSEAWERERARELRAANNTPATIASRLRLN